MPSLLAERAAAEHFARLLEGGGTSGAPASVQALAGLAGRLQSLPLAPRPEFASALRSTLMAAATTPGGVVTPLPPRGAAHTALTHPGTVHALTRAGTSSAVSKAVVAKAMLVPWVSGAAATFVAVAGVSIAAHRSLPGDPFYGVKALTERVQYDLAGSAHDKAVAQLGFASARLAEISDLLAQRPGDVPALRSALADWTHASAPAITTLLAEVRAGRHPSAVQLATFTSEQLTGLSRLYPQLPATLHPAALAGARLMTTARATLAALSPGLLTPVLVPSAPGSSGGGTGGQLPIGPQLGTGSGATQTAVPQAPGVPTVPGTPGHGTAPTPPVASPHPGGTVPGGLVPSGLIPSGGVPSGLVPSGLVPSGLVPTHLIPTGVLPSALLPDGTHRPTAIPLPPLIP